MPEFASYISLQSVFDFLGGIGLFLLGMRLMTDGLKVAAGPGLRAMLGSATDGRVRAILTGATITAVVQSSSAVIFAVMGFVNAGLLSLAGAVGIVIGANVGTTLTSWIVALVGFKLDLGLIAMPAITLGMGLWIRGVPRLKALGQALVGFGVFFLGLATLKSAFADIAPQIELTPHVIDGAVSTLFFAFLGAMLTVLMQSSSASLALTLTAASQGLLPVTAAAAMVIGANIGTTSTAVFASIGATHAARKTAAAHVIFNVAIALPGLVFITPLIHSAHWLASTIGADLLPATELAIFHTQMKLVGMFAFAGFIPHLVSILERRLAQPEPANAHAARYLDITLRDTPLQALDAIQLELGRLSNLTIELAHRAISSEGDDDASVRSDSAAIFDLSNQIIDFVSEVSSSDIAEAEHAFPAALRVTQHYRMATERAVELAQLPLAQHGASGISASVDELRLLGTRIMHNAQLDNTEVTLDSLGKQLDNFESHYHGCKGDLLRAGSQNVIKATGLIRELDRISTLRRLIEQICRARLTVDNKNMLGD